MVSNPVGYKSRYRLFEQFHEHMRQQKNVHLTVVEGAFGHREPVAPAGDNTVVVNLQHELWHKENLLNIGISRLPSDWRYMAWLDADIHFTNPHWVNQTIQALQHHQLVQPWRDCIDLGPDGETLQTHKSFGSQFALGAPRNVVSGPSGYDLSGKVAASAAFWHPGYAWAARREAIDNMGGLMDFPILGSADHHMAMAFIGDVMRSVPTNAHPNFKRKLLTFQTRVEKTIRQDVGFTPGSIVHYFHGKKKNRKYAERWSVLTKNQFDPERDIKKDWQGVWHLVDHGTPRSISLRDDIRAYFRQRSEDSIDLE
jgi:hypothetical protein